MDPLPESPVGRILVSDDDPSARGALVAVLQHARYWCHPTASATEALRSLEEHEFDLIVADIQMEGNADLEMVRALGQRDDSPPIILVTGQPSIETATQALRLRVFDYLRKPVDGEKLVALAHEGVASGRMMRVVRKHRMRIEESLAQINRCEEMTRTTTGAGVNDALGTYLNLAVQHSLSTIAEIGTLAEAIVSQDEAGELQRRLQLARPLVLVDAIRETIQVLERTKTSFKSRELAELRKKLEELMEMSRQH